MLSGEQSSGVDSRRPTLAWLEDSSSCSDIPKLEGDRYATKKKKFKKIAMRNSAL